MKINPATCPIDDLAVVAPLPSRQHDASLVIGTNSTPVYLYRSEHGGKFTDEYHFTFVAIVNGVPGVVVLQGSKWSKQRRELAILVRETALREKWIKERTIFAVKEENGQADPHTCLCFRCFQTVQNRVVARATAMRNPAIPVYNFANFEDCSTDPLLRCIICGETHDTENTINQTETKDHDDQARLSPGTQGS